MSQTPLDFLNLFVRSPGDIIYFLTIVAITQAALFMALSERWRRPQNRDSGRYLLAFLGIVVTWIVMILGVLYTLVTNQDLSSILPPLERVATVVLILLVGWAFLTADHDTWGRLPNIVLLLLIGIAVGGYIITGTQWTNSLDKTNFNLTTLGTAWTFIAAVFCVAGILLCVIYFRLITDAPLKLLFFAVLLVGHVATLLQISQYSLIGDYPGTIRLATLAAFPLLAVIVYRMVINHMQTELVSRDLPFPQVPPAPGDISGPAPVVAVSAPSVGLLPTSGSSPSVSPIQRDSIQLLKTLGLILEEATPATIPERIVTSGLEVLKAEIGALFTIQDANYADIIAAYNMSQQRPITGLAVNLDNQPTLVNAVERRLQRPLYPDRNSDELRDLYNRLDVDQVGPTYFQPLMSGKDLIGVLMIGMPYEKRELEESERELLKGIGIIGGNLLALSNAARSARLKAEEQAIQALVQGVPMQDAQDSSAATARQEMQASLQASRDHVTDLSRQVTQLKIELDYERGRVASVIGDTEEGLSVSQRILTLTDEQQKLRDERDQLATRLQEAQTTLAGATATDNESVLKTMVDVLNRDKEDLNIQRDQLQQQLDNLRNNQQMMSTPEGAQEMVERMRQEKTSLESERNQLSNRLDDIANQLKALGIEGGTTGLGQLIAQLTDQRSSLQARIESLTLERGALLNERTQLEGSMRQEKERSARIIALENEIKHLASDREALTKQREQLRGERDELVAKQDAIKQHRARLLAESAGYQIELAEAHQEQAKLRQQIQQLMTEKSSFATLQNRLQAEKQGLETERDMLLARAEGDRDRVQQVGDDRVESLTRMIDEVSDQRSLLEQQLHDAQMQLAAAHNQIDLLQVRATGDISVEPTTNGAAVPASEKYDRDVFLGMVQELRTPLTSIVGYVDLLLDETAGIIGEMQRKFLQRVASNITRLTFQLDDLTRAIAIDTNRFLMTPEPINVVELLEDAISNSTYQFREKGLTVNLNLDDNAPRIKADRDAITQILGQLLTNAYLASPPDSQIFVTAHQQNVKLSDSSNLAQPTHSLLIAVEDRGGGISQEDLSRVFARKYKADNPLVQGLGETGVGLSIAKTLAEKHGGGLWVETRDGLGSIFYFALPLETALEASIQGN